MPYLKRLMSRAMIGLMAEHIQQWHGSDERVYEAKFPAISGGFVKLGDAAKKYMTIGE